MNSPLAAFASAPSYINIQNKDAKDCYPDWPAPVTIISDGPYGLNRYHGDLASPAELPAWYEPHIAAWTEKATPETTLWFWNTEIGWATVHPVLEKYGWQYVGCCIWDKSIFSVAGDVDTRAEHRFPPMTKICAQYVRDPVHAKAHCPHGATNILHIPPLEDKERIKAGQKVLHLSQKPVALIEEIIRFSTDEEDIIWDPFAGTAAVAAVCMTTTRKCYAAEIDKEVYDAACERLLDIYDEV